ncbi:Citrate lyase gamma chain [Salmonella enterica subsp. enterica serovar Montevideo str. S5-403]|uniref:Citrate lyase acyl carrier protein n=1 Tax=Salmonella enterica subsp. enterica serovar Montevideo str. S5-403 TaxID=913242 RepID=G5PZ68_SALMO|nr:Citrate lyase gamma chain [Salmonella enterica subsp. enterica serovar Montevideo str. S5-403]
MKINQLAVAGTLESGDVMIRIAPLDTQDIDLQISSSVEKQFGEAIRATILEVLSRYDVRGVQLNVDDKGALDCILRARLETLLARGRHNGETGPRASGIAALPWEDRQ